VARRLSAVARDETNSQTGTSLENISQYFPRACGITGSR
jgi:hypothetical protein